jgi:hypothetical protein
MATYADLNPVVRTFMRSYPFARFALDPVPCAPRRELARSRVALVTTAGFSAPDQPRFSTTAMGDASFRVIGNDVPLGSLRESHKSGSFDRRGIQRDPNLVLPRDRFAELHERGRIGSLNGYAVSFMGAIMGPRRLIRDTAPEAARRLKNDDVDVAFLTPV